MGRKKKKAKPPNPSEIENARHLSLNGKDLSVNNEDPPKESSPGKAGKKKVGSFKLNEIYKSSLNKQNESHIDISVYKDILQRSQNIRERKKNRKLGTYIHNLQKLESRSKHRGVSVANLVSVHSFNCVYSRRD